LFLSKFKILYASDTVIDDELLKLDLLKENLPDFLKVCINLKSEINWQSYGGKHCECIFTKFCQLIYQPTRHGMDYRRAHFSTDICNSRITRKEAIDILKDPPWAELDLENELRFVANKLGYEVNELKNFMNQPPLWYKDFSNNEFILGKIYNLYRLLTGRPLASSWWG